MRNLVASGLLLTSSFLLSADDFGGQAGPGITDAQDAKLRFEQYQGRLIFADDFTHSGRPDPRRWGYEEGLVRNGEAQFYTVDRPENARVDDGHLIITTRKEPWKNAGVTSASLITLGRFAFTYGKVEIRAKVPAGRGTWPALWTLGDYDPALGWPKGHWPACGEIDLMEYVGMEPDRLFFTVHTEAYNHTKGTQRGHNVPFAKPWESFQTFGLLWTPQDLTWYLDGQPVFRFANDGQGPATWPFDRPQYLLMNLAIGGGWGGQKGIDEALFPAEFRIDHVRVWQGPEGTFSGSGALVDVPPPPSAR